MCLARLSGRGLAGWVQGGEGRGGFCKGDMAEWTQELETFAGASVSSGGKRGRLSPNSAGQEILGEWKMKASGPRDVVLWELLGSLTTRMSSRSLCDTLQPSSAPAHGEGPFFFLGENFRMWAWVFE